MKLHHAEMKRCGGNAGVSSRTLTDQVLGALFKGVIVCDSLAASDKGCMCAVEDRWGDLGDNDVLISARRV